jgi:hypothetical protein
MKRPGPTRQRRLEPMRQRLRRLLARLLRRGPVKRQRVYLVTLGERRLKRIVFSDSHKASEVARNLEALRGSELVPDLVAHYGEEVWVEFLEGEPVGAARPEIVDEMARIFASLYTRDARLVQGPESGVEERLARDLDFLREVGLFDAPAHLRLREFAQKAAPAAVWVGWDYTDPLPMNLLRTPRGELRIIDVESVVRERLIGIGVAKALARWLGADRQRLLARLEERGVPPFTAYLPFVELHFLASWTKRSLLHGKKRLVDPARFRPFLDAD